MQLLKKYLWTVSLVLPLTFYAQNPQEELLNWQAARKLTWNDYSGKLIRHRMQQLPLLLIWALNTIFQIAVSIIKSIAVFQKTNPGSVTKMILFFHMNKGILTLQSYLHAN